MDHFPSYMSTTSLRWEWEKQSFGYHSLQRFQERQSMRETSTGHPHNTEPPAWYFVPILLLANVHMQFDDMALYKAFPVSAEFVIPCYCLMLSDVISFAAFCLTGFWNQLWFWMEISSCLESPPNERKAGWYENNIIDTNDTTQYSDSVIGKAMRSAHQLMEQLHRALRIHWGWKVAYQYCNKWIQIVPTVPHKSLHSKAQLWAFLVLMSSSFEQQRFLLFWNAAFPSFCSAFTLFQARRQTFILTF